MRIFKEVNFETNLKKRKMNSEKEKKVKILRKKIKSN